MADLVRLLTVDDVADTLAVSKWTIYRAVRSGALEATHVGRQLRFSGAQLDAFLSSQRDRVST